jgi:hypothetical protein
MMITIGSSGIAFLPGLARRRALCPEHKVIRGVIQRPEFLNLLIKNEIEF